MIITNELTVLDDGNRHGRRHKKAHPEGNTQKQRMLLDGFLRMGTTEATPLWQRPFPIYASYRYLPK